MAEVSFPLQHSGWRKT